MAASGLSSGLLIPKQTSLGLANNYSTQRESLKLHHTERKRVECDITMTVSINQSGAKERKQRGMITVRDDRTSSVAAFCELIRFDWYPPSTATMCISKGHNYTYIRLVLFSRD